jgi:hypothetical protein
MRINTLGSKSNEHILNDLSMSGTVSNRYNTLDDDRDGIIERYGNLY